MAAENLLQLILITNDPKLAQEACAAGVNRIMVDLEVLGKKERQSSRNTIISDHKLEDISHLRLRLPLNQLITRVNPSHSGSYTEINEAIDRGSNLLMLPMFRTAGEVQEFIDHVGGRCKTMLLVETPDARTHLDDILAIPGIDEIYIGLNDLSLGLGFPFLFQVLSEGIIDELAAKIRPHDIAFGFGGVGRMGGGPLPGELIITEHKRLGSQLVILSRVFHGNSSTLQELESKGIDLRREVAKLRSVEKKASARTLKQVEEDRLAAKHIIRRIAGQLPHGHS